MPHHLIFVLLYLGWGSVRGRLLWRVVMAQKCGRLLWCVVMAQKCAGPGIDTSPHLAQLVAGKASRALFSDDTRGQRLYFDEGVVWGLYF